MSGKYYKLYKPLCGKVMILPFPEEEVSEKVDLVIPLLGAEGNIIDLSGGDAKKAAGISVILKGIIVEKGMDHPFLGSYVKRRDVVLFSKGAGIPITLPTQMGSGDNVDREYIILEEGEIIATL